MRATRTIAALVLTGSLAGCWLPGGEVHDPPVFDEATHGDSDFDFPSTFPNPSTLVGSLGRNDTADYYSSTGSAGGEVTVTCWLTNGWVENEVIVGAGPGVTEGSCNGLPITRTLTDGAFSIIVSAPQVELVNYRIVVEAS